MTLPRSAYVHIPFCRRRCFYCDFPIAVVGDKPVNKAGDRINGSNSGTIAHYVEVLCQEIQQFPSLGGSLETVFFGGGTPSLLSPEQLQRILNLLDHQFGMTSNAEISMEVDPATFDAPQIQAYRAAGVNRVSLGVQAFQRELLQIAGRSHTVADIHDAIQLVRDAGFTNISLDLISGLPHQTLDQWEASLNMAIALQPTHISCYDLTIETGTPFSKQYRSGLTPLPSDETTADMYRAAQRLLTRNGFEHYEISNYAQPGYQCQHNRVYWQNQPFYGFGMGATSYLAGIRFARPRKTWEYYEWVNRRGWNDWALKKEKHDPNSSPEEASSQLPVPSALPSTFNSDLLLDTLMVGLRLAEGLDIAALVNQFGEPAIAQVCKCLQPFVQKGWITFPSQDHNPVSGRLRLTDPEGFLFSNVILVALFEMFEN